jgi:hypothetical protein
MSKAGREVLVMLPYRLGRREDFIICNRSWPASACVREAALAKASGNGINR